MYSEKEGYKYPNIEVIKRNKLKNMNLEETRSAL